MLVLSTMWSRNSRQRLNVVLMATLFSHSNSAHIARNAKSEQLAGVLALSLDESLAKTGIPDLLRDVCRCVAVLGDNVRVDLREVNKPSEGANYNPFADFFKEDE